MKRVLIVGAGAQGAPCASILARDIDVSEVVLADIDLDLANKVKDKIKSNKITTVKVDAGKIEDIERAAKGADVIINLIMTLFTSNIMKAALKSSAHYVDTTFGEPSLLDIRARDNILSQIIEERPLELDNEFKRAGLTGLIGCGGSPGVVNVLARYICDKLDHVDGIGIRYGVKSQEGSKEVVGTWEPNTWEPNWSPFRELWGYAIEPTVFEDGEYKKYPVFSGCEEYDFPDPVGRVLITYHQHQEQITLARFIGKGMKYAWLKYPVHPIVGALVKLGFGNPEPVDVKGAKVVPRDVLLKLAPHPVNSFFAEDGAKLPPEVPEFVDLEIKGAKSGENVTYRVSWPYSFFRTPAEQMELYKKFGTAMIAVALPAIVGAKMCVEGNAEKGVIPAECLDPMKFLKMMAAMDCPVKFDEIVSREVSIS